MACSHRVSCHAAMACSHRVSCHLGKACSHRVLCHLGMACSHRIGLLRACIRVPRKYTPGTAEGGKGAWGRPTQDPHSRPRRVHARKYRGWEGSPERGHVVGVIHEGLGVPYALTNGCKWPHGAVRVPRNRKVHAHPPPHRACTGVGRENIIILIGFEHPVVPQGASAADGAFEYYSGESATLGPRRP